MGLLVTLLALGLTSSCGGGAQEEKLQLRLNLEAGESYRLRMITDQKVSQTIQGQQQDLTQTVGIGYTFDVGEVKSDGSMLATVTYEWVRFEQKGPAGEILYDSANPPDRIDPSAAGYPALLGQSFTMELSPEGQVKDLWGVDDMLAGILGALDLPPGGMRDTLEQSFRSQFGEQSMKENMENMMAIYPADPVDIGDTWTKKVVVATGFPMILENSWTLKSRQDGVATIAVFSKVEPNPDAPPLEIGPIKISYELSGEQQGTMELDEGTGWTLGAHMTQAFSGEMKMGDDMSWPISIDSTVRWEALDEQ
jgi:hypothetical protein